MPKMFAVLIASDYEKTSNQQEQRSEEDLEEVHHKRKAEEEVALFLKSNGNQYWRD